MTDEVIYETEHPFAALTPDRVLAAVESLGFNTDARFFALNSYENRDYQFQAEDNQPYVVKFYRPGRWTDTQIEEEHAFALELAENEIPIAAPLLINGETLHHHGGYRLLCFHQWAGDNLKMITLTSLNGWAGSLGAFTE